MNKCNRETKQWIINSMRIKPWIRFVMGGWEVVGGWRSFLNHVSLWWVLSRSHLACRLYPIPLIPWYEQRSHDKSQSWNMICQFGSLISKLFPLRRGLQGEPGNKATNLAPHQSNTIPGTQNKSSHLSSTGVLLSLIPRHLLTVCCCKFEDKTTYWINKNHWTALYHTNFAPC